MPEIEYVTVANHAEVLNGLLYVQGAGWSDVRQPVGPNGEPIGPNGQPALVHFGIGVSILVGWNETNRRYPWTLKLVHEDGTELMNLAAQVEAGRPPGTVPGAEFRSVFAVNVDIQFPKTGRYELRAELADNPARSTAFRVQATPVMFGQPKAS